MKRLLVGLLILTILLVGCSEVSLPTAAEAPYKIIWHGESSGTVYSDNYELGSSVVVAGYWERTGGLNYRYVYRDKLLILDASEVIIEERGTAE